MAVIIDGHKPNFSALSLKLLRAYYYMDVKEVLAIAIESFRHEHAENFFKNSLLVVLCERDSCEERVREAKETIDDLWKEVYPWLLDAYRIYPPLRNLIVHHIDYEENHVRLYTHVDMK